MSECEIADCAVCDNGWECCNCADSVEIRGDRDSSQEHDEPILCDLCAQELAATLPGVQAELKEAQAALLIERARADAAAERQVFRLGMPTIEAVREHAEKHPVMISHPAGKRSYGGQWIVIDKQSSFDAPQFVRLKICTELDIGPPSEDQGEFVGRVLIQNGFSFWQALHLCKWAERSLYLPVSPRGLPL